jgi:hypothetical protein
MFRRPLLRSASLSSFVAVGFLVMIAEPATAGAQASSAARNQDCREIASFDSEGFPDLPNIDNKWLPLLPGTHFVLEGTAVGDDGLTHAHRVVTTVTDLVKVIDGVRTIVVFDRDYDDGALAESELAFEAQDDGGSVWNVGEYPEEYDNGKLVGAPSTWIAGIAHAEAGVGMLADPQVRTRSYLQGVAPEVDFRDCAKVAGIGQRICVPVGCYDNVLAIDEWAPLEPEGGHQLKYYAPGVGNIRVDAVGGTTPEVLELVELTKLGAGAMVKVRNEALNQDRRGYRVSPEVYGQTSPARQIARVD